MVTVYEIRPHYAGFGLYERGEEVASFPDLDSLDDYLRWACAEFPYVDLVEEGESDYEQVSQVNGCLYNQNGGTVLGWRDGEGYVALELVCVS